MYLNNAQLKLIIESIKFRMENYDMKTCRMQYNMARELKDELYCELSPFGTVENSLSNWELHPVVIPINEDQ